MARETKTIEFKVVVHPRRLGELGMVSMSDRMIEPDEERRIKRYRERCEDIVQDVRRHVDNVGSVEVVEEKEAFCGFCGYQWTEDGDEYNGGCCDEDVAAGERLLAAEGA